VTVGAAASEKEKKGVGCARERRSPDGGGKRENRTH